MVVYELNFAELLRVVVGTCIVEGAVEQEQFSVNIGDASMFDCSLLPTGE